MQDNVNSVFLLGPTAAGKTSLGVRLAERFGWDIISADSRQVYKGLDLGSGKDLGEYNGVRHHLIDVTTLATEYNAFNFQSDFYSIAETLFKKNGIPFVVGGTGMYIDSVVSNYDFIPVEVNPELRSGLEKKSLEELGKILLELKPDLHNKSDLLLKDRLIRAIEIEMFKNTDAGKAARERNALRPKINPLIIGTTVERSVLHRNIDVRLKERISQGMIDEVKNLHDKDGFSWERLEKLGLEYRFTSLYLEGKIQSYEEYYYQLYHAICQFAKRQETWFRSMEKKGVKINWLPKDNDSVLKFSAAVRMLEEAVAGTKN